MIIDVAKKLAQALDSNAVGKQIAQVLDLKALSKDLVVALTDKAMKQKDLVIDAMANEFSNFLDKINISEEAQKIMDGMTIDVTATIRFKDKKIKDVPVNISSQKSGKKARKKPTKRSR